MRSALVARPLPVARASHHIEVLLNEWVLDTALATANGARDGAVLTYYKALVSEPPETARVRMAARSWEQWRDEVLALCTLSLIFA